MRRATAPPASRVRFESVGNAVHNAGVADRQTAPRHLAKDPEGQVEEAPPQFFEKDGNLHRTRPRTLVLLGDVDAEPALLTQLGEEVQWSGVRGVAFADVLARDLVLTEPSDGVAEQVLFRSELESHLIPRADDVTPDVSLSKTLWDCRRTLSPCAHGCQPVEEDILLGRRG